MDSNSSNHSSPLSNEEYEIDLIDSTSSSSSSDQSSSPNSDSNYSINSNNNSNNNNWAFHPLALTNLLPNIVSSPVSNNYNNNRMTSSNDWSGNMKSISIQQQSQQQLLQQQQQQQSNEGTTVGEMELTSDFWANNNNNNNNGLNSLNNGGLLNSNNDYDMNNNQTDYQDIYSSNAAKLSPPSINNNTSNQQSYYTPSFNIPHETSSFTSSLGISPLLTNTRPSSTLPSPSLTSNNLLNHFNQLPPLPNNQIINNQFDIKLEDEDEEELDEAEEEMDQEQDGNHSYSNRASTSASGSGERERLAPSQLPQLPTKLTTSHSKREVISTNLVAKDAVVASSIISSISTHPISHSQFSSLQLLVLGVPTTGAKSRVETQIKISLVLVKPKVGGNKIKRDQEGAEGWMTSDGGLSPDAGGSLERIGSWSHLRLPHYLALKKKGKRVAPDPAEEDTLYLDVAVKRGSETCEEIFICTGCRQREEKRALRKKEARVRPLKESELPVLGAEDEEMRKVVVFNCAEFVEFGNGEVVLPTRITCYCRHHKERLGFSVSFSIKTASGIILASGATPPIMITDDHKTNHLRPATTIPSIPSSAEISLDSIDLKTSTKSKKAKASAAASKKAELIASKSKRNSGRTKSTRGVSTFGDSEDELLPEPSARIQAVNAAAAANAAASSSNLNLLIGGKKQHGVAKPYDSDSRPSRSKRQPSGVHRSPAFAMTPLSGLSKPSSPVMRPQSDSNGGIPSPPLSNLYDSTAPSPAVQNNWDSALGLGGMDSFMGDGTNATISNNTASTSTAYSTSGMSATSPAQSYDWRSAASSPSANSVVDTYNSFYNTIASPPSIISDNNNTNNLLSPQLLQQSSQPQISQGLNDFSQFYNTPIPTSVVSSAFNWAFPTPPPPPPRISRLIPGEGPVHGGIEVTILGENFVRDLVCVFGDSAAISTHYWSSNTLVCILPPSPNPGPVVVGIKGVPLTVEAGSQLQLFTYKDDSDRSLLELALQVVGLKMTGKLEEASAVAMRIVGDNTPSVSRHTSRQTSPTDTANLAMSMNRAADSVYNTPNSSRPPSRQASIVNLNLHMNTLATSPLPLPHAAAGGQSRNFEGIVIKFLSLIDLDPSLIPGAAPSLPLTQSPLSHLNAQRHSLLHLATVLGFHRLSSFLISRGIDLTARDRNGYTALHFAALYGRVAITRQLLDAGASMEVKNIAGQTPLDIATERDDVDVQELLLRPRGLHSRVVSQVLQPPYLQQQLQQRQIQQTLQQAPNHQYPSTSTPVYSRRTSFDSTVDYSSSDYDVTSSSSSDNDDESFHSSDEDGEISDEERGFSPTLNRASRNASMVSLHYLLDAEADVNSEFGESTFVEAIPVSDEKNFQNLIRPSSSAASSIAAATNIQGAELARKLSASLPFKPLSSNIEKLPLSEKTPIISSTVWEKIPRLPYANEAWEKMRLPNSFVMPPLQMPELSVFNASMPTFSPKTWMSNSGNRNRRTAGSEGSNSGIEESEGESGIDGPSSQAKLARDWRTLYGPWWQKGAASPPPPMYSPIDTLQLPPTPSTSNLQPISSLRESTLRRRSGFVSEEISDSEISTNASTSGTVTYLPQKKKLQGLQHDKMLLCFWLPVLTIALALAAFSSFDYISLLFSH